VHFSLLKGGYMSEKGGRPSKFKEDLLKDAEVLAGLGFTEKDFCTYWGICPRTLYRWKNKNGGELRQAIEKGKLNANITATKALLNKVKSGNLTAIIFWLTNRCPESWQDRRALVQQNESKIANIVITGVKQEERNEFIKTIIKRQIPDRFPQTGG